MSVFPLHRTKCCLYVMPVLVGLIFQFLPKLTEAEPKQVRLALVISNSVYASATEALPGAARDAQNVAKTLIELGFSVAVEKDLTKQGIISAIQQFKKELSTAGNNSIGLLYYAGHGGADPGNSDNFLIPVDAEVKDIAVSGVSVRSIQNDLQQLASADAHPAAIVIVIDACRTLAQFGRNRAAGGNTKPVVSAMTTMSEPEAGYLFAFSTSKNQSASDEGDFAQALAKHMLRKGLTIPQVFEEVQRDVYTKTNQFPIYQPNIAAQICFISCESETKGAFHQSEILLKEVREEAEAGMRTIKGMDAPTRCKGGWDRLQVLRESAEKHTKSGNFDTAGETYKIVAGTAVAIETYLSIIDRVVPAAQQLKAQRENTNVARKGYEKSTYISPYRSNFKSKLGMLADFEKLKNRPIDWKPLRQIESQMEAFAKAENYIDATERAIEGYNLSLKTLEALLGGYVGEPIPKEDLIQRMKKFHDQMQPTHEAAIDTSMIDNSPAGRACK
jgi:Caspase domain